MDTLYTFGDNINHYKTVPLFGLMNSATKRFSTLQKVVQLGVLLIEGSWGTLEMDLGLRTGCFGLVRFRAQGFG